MRLQVPPQKGHPVTVDTCPLTDLDPAQCGCSRHRRRGRRGQISPAALERLFGPPAAPKRRLRVVQIDTEPAALTGDAQPIDRITNDAGIVCRSCGHYQHTRDRWLCDWCAEQWEVDLINAGPIVAELNTAITKQVRMGSPNCGGGHDRTAAPLPFNESASTAHTQLEKVLRHLGHRIIGWGGGPLDQLARRVHDVTYGRLHTYREAPELAAELRAATRRALATIDRPRPTVYLGPCPNCQLALHVAEGTPVHTCPCGYTVAVAQALDDRDKAAADLNVTFPELIEAHIAPRRTLYRWRKEGKLRPCNTWDGRPVYRLGDAKELAAGGSRKSAGGTTVDKLPEVAHSKH